AIGGDFLSLDRLAFDHASASHSAPPMASIEQAAYLLVLFCLRPEDCIDLIEQHRWRAILATDFAGQVRGRHIDGLDRIRDEQFRYFECSRLSRCWFWRQEGNARRAFPRLHHMGMRNPERVRDVSFSERIDNEAFEKGVGIIKRQSQGAGFYLFAKLGMHPIGELLGTFFSAASCAE